MDTLYTYVMSAIIAHFAIKIIEVIIKRICE